MYYLESMEQIKKASDKFDRVKPEVKTMSFGQYAVQGSGGGWYTVACYVDDLGRKVIDCSCETFDGYVCYHSVGAIMRHIVLATERKKQMENK